MQPISDIFFSAIVAMDEQRAIGKNNQLLWHLPADLKHFKELTTGHAILMGRKTYESIGKPLPNRTNIILTHGTDLNMPGCVIINSLKDLLQSDLLDETQELFIIGGAQIYQQLLPYTQRIYLTLVHHTFGGDVFFPELNPQEWQETSREAHQADEKNPYAYTFLTLERKVN